MKMTLKETLKRLTTGFISSAMMLSFVLMPIPRIGNVYAEDTAIPEGGCRTDEQQVGDRYIPGCDFNDALNAASFNSSTRYNDKGEKFMDKVPGFIEQYIVALTGVILINSLNWQRLYKYNPVAYGNDCPKAFGHKIGIPVAALSGLSNVVGDLSSNMKFQNLAKEAADLAFVPQARASGEGTEEGIREDNNQTDSYNALIKIIEGQVEALKIKKGMALASSIGFGVADGIEIANMIMMGSMCTVQWADKFTKEGIKQAEYVSAQTTSSAGAAVPGAQGCIAAASVLAAHKVTCEGQNVFATAKSAAKVAEAIKTGKGVMDAFGFLDFLTTVSGADLISSGFKTGVDLGSKAGDIAIEAAEEAAMTASATADIALYSSRKALSESLSGTAKACPGLGVLAEAYGASAENIGSHAIQCCGGVGINLPLMLFLEAKDVATINFMIPIKKKAFTLTKNKLIDGILKSAVESLIGIPRFLIPSNNTTITETGTAHLQGVPAAPGVASFNKDIKVHNLFGGVNTVNFTPELDLKKAQDVKDLKFYFKNAFEAQIRKLALTQYNLDNEDSVDIKLKRMVNVNSKVNEIMKSFNVFIDEQFFYLYTEQYIDPTKKSFKNVLAGVVDLVVPSANAGLGGTLFGAGVSALGGAVDGPWSSVLKLTGNIITLHGMLGKFVKRTGLASPIGRTLTWAAMSAMAGVSYKMTKDSQKEAEKNLEIVISERDKFMGVSKNTSGLGEGEVGVALNLTSIDPADPNGFKGKTACVEKNGSGYSPAVCGPVRARSGFTVPSLQGGANGASGSLYVQGANFMSDFNTLGANGKLTGDSFDSATLTNMERVNNAIKAKNDKHRKEYDKMMKGGDKKIAAGVTSLQERVAKIRKTLLDNAGKNQLSGAPTSAVASVDKKADEKKKVSTPTGYKVPTSPTVGSTPGMDLDFGSDDSLMDDLSSDKEAVSMSDFEINHDDINKKKDVSIFKLLSNRYILRYPKLMEEKKQ
jgi:hypothetical protein